MSMAGVTTSVENNILIARIENPPVNALSHTVRGGLIAAVDQLNSDETLDAMVLAGTARGFSAGADVTEFGAAMKAPKLGEVVARLENSEKPVVAAIHGFALGGGLEVALSCHYRIADSDAKLGLPEVTLGILPGAGGCVRLPRLIGAEAALAMITSGRPIAAKAALQSGLVDRLADENVDEVARGFAADLVESNAGVRRICDIDPTPVVPEILAQERKRLTRRYPGQIAPQMAVDLVEMVLTEPFETAIAKEAETCKALVGSDQSRALRYLFAAERLAQKPEGIAPDTIQRSIRRVGIIGPGTMGCGIAIASLDAGFDVILVGRSQDALQKAEAAIDKTYGGAVKRGKLTEDAVAARKRNLTFAPDLSTLKTADLVIETISEDPQAKKDVIGAIDALVRADTIIASNTSFLDVEWLADCTSRPENFVGMHFFNPANLMKLVENIRTARAAPDVLATITGFARKLGKLPVMVGRSEGFVANRMLSKRTREALFLLQDGATPQQVDRVLTEFGFPIGPFALADMAGLDVLAATREARYAGMAERERACDIIETLVAEGRLGRKTGAGYYRYGDDGKPTPDPEFASLLAAHRARIGATSREISDDEVRERCLFAMINEGAKILEEGGATRASDIDVIWARGMGFPAWRGGPMHYADTVGLADVLAALEKYAGLVGEDFFAPAQLIKTRVVKGEGLTSQAPAAQRNTKRDELV